MSDNEIGKTGIKPENVVTGITTAGMVVGAGYVLYKGLPYVNQIIEMGWYAVAAGVPLAFLIFIGLNKDVHKAGWYAWKSFMRWLTGKVIELDPIAIMERYKEHFISIVQDALNAMKDFRGEIKNLDQKIKEGQKQIERSMSLASQAKELSKTDHSYEKTVELETFNASQYQESNNQFIEMRNFMNGHLERCKEFYEAALFNQQKLETKIAIKKSQRESMLALRKTMSSFKRIFQGDEELEMFNRALEIENQFVANTLGEFEQFNDDTQSILQAGRLDKLANKADAVARINAWNKQKIDNLKINTGLRIDQSVANISSLPSSSESFDDLFDSVEDQTKVSRFKN